MENVPMKILLNFEECIKDSPQFRESVLQSEMEMAELENQLERMTRTCSAMVESGKTFSNVSRVFLSSLDEFTKHSKDDPLVQKAMKQFTNSMSEVANFHEVLFEHAQKTVKNQLVTFLKEDVKGARDTKKLFDKASDEYSSCLSKHASVNKLKPGEVEDATVHLANARSHFRNVSMNYVVQVNMLQKKNRFQVIDKLLSYVHALSTFFHQGYDLMKDLQPFIKKISSQLDNLHQSAQKDYSTMTKEQDRYMKMTGDSGLYMKQVDGQLVIEGHLFKRASNAFKTWNRRWFTIKDKKLYYQKKKDDATVAIDDIRLCTVRAADDVERQYCFEVISPGKSFLLQADSVEAREAWISALQSSIDAAFKQSMNASQAPTTIVNKPVATVTLTRTSSASSLPSSESNVEETEGKSPNSFLEDGHSATMAAVYQVRGNRMCADCGKTDPRWASISLGVTLCIDCSGVHRSLGVHISKVRSLTLDEWEPEVIKIMYNLGNTKVNEIYQASLPLDDAIKPNCSNKDRQIFIKAKYADRKYVMSLPTAGSAVSGSSDRKLKRWTVSKRVESKNRDPEEEDSNGAKEKKAEESESVEDLLVFGRTGGEDLQGIPEEDILNMEQLTANNLFYKSAEAGNLPVLMLASCNGASPNFSNPDHDGKTPLMAASSVGSIQTSEYLLLNGAQVHVKDERSRTALHYAALHNHTGIACQLLKRRVDLDAVDAEGMSALEIAVKHENADIVTLIRLKKMNNQMKEDDAGSYQQNDDLVNDVFRDFTRRATSNLPLPRPQDCEYDLLGSLVGASKQPRGGEQRQMLLSQDQSSVVLGNQSDDPVESTV